MIPVLCRMGPLTIYSYGVACAVALFLAAGMAAARARAFGFEAARAVDAVFLLFIAGMAGSRLFFIFQHLDLYRGEFWKALDLREGGLVWYGGFLVAFAAAWGIASRFRWNRWVFGDFIAPILAAAHAVGRIGCFLNGCCGGRYPAVPVQLLEAVFLGALSIYLWKRTGRMKREGDTFLLYCFLYPAGRFALEFLRGDQVRYWFFSIPQMTGAAVFVAAGIVWFLRHGSRKV